MGWTSAPLWAGIASTVIFAGSSLPMLGKAWRTRDLRSYSLGNLVMANAGNAVYTVYVVSLPLGPIWLLHGFNLSTSALMLIWFLRYPRPTRLVQPQLSGLHDDGATVGQRQLAEDRRDVMVGGLG